MAETPIENVSDTALWVAHYRAQESERSDALFRDPYAKILVGERGRRIAETMKSTSKYTSWSLSIRTYVIDQFIQSLIKDGIDTVLNLGTGLDTRPYRMALPNSLRWVEVDYPNIIDHKEKLLAKEKPRCQLERVRLDLADRSKRKMLFADIASRSKKVLVITEGVIPYLTEAQVGDLADDLHDVPAFEYWIGEFFSKEIYTHLQDPVRMKKMANAPFVFFPKDWFGFFKAHRWAPREIKFLGEESVRLNRPVPAPWWSFIFWPLRNTEGMKKYLRFMGYVLFYKE